MRSLAIAAFLLASMAAPAAPQTPVTEIRMTARKYQFDPHRIEVKRGDHVRLIITATDRDHGIKIEAFHIDQELKKGVPVTVEFTAGQAGTFHFECSKFCGLGHKRMQGEVVVE